MGMIKFGVFPDRKSPEATLRREKDGSGVVIPSEYKCENQTLGMGGVSLYITSSGRLVTEGLKHNGVLQTVMRRGLQGQRIQTSSGRTSPGLVASFSGGKRDQISFGMDSREGIVHFSVLPGPHRPVLKGED